MYTQNPSSRKLPVTNYIVTGIQNGQEALWQTFQTLSLQGKDCRPSTCPHFVGT